MTSRFRLPKRWLAERMEAMKTETKGKNLIGLRWRHISVSRNDDWLDEKRKSRNVRQWRRKPKERTWLADDDVTFPLTETRIGWTRSENQKTADKKDGNGREHSDWLLMTSHFRFSKRWLAERAELPSRLRFLSISKHGTNIGQLLDGFKFWRIYFSSFFHDYCGLKRLRNESHATN